MTGPRGLARSLLEPEAHDLLFFDGLAELDAWERRERFEPVDAVSATSRSAVSSTRPATSSLDAAGVAGGSLMGGGSALAYKQINY